MGSYKEPKYFSNDHCLLETNQQLLLRTHIMHGKNDFKTQKLITYYLNAD